MSTNRVGPGPNIATALLVLRIALGVTMLLHGYQKTFTFGFAGVTTGFTQYGVPMPGITAPLVSLVELLAGCAVLVGLLTRLAAFGLGVDMLGAITFVHFKNGFFLPTGFEFAFLLLLVSVTLMLSGPGEYSIDAVIARRREASPASAS
jgi:putative oxidoreductase